MDTTEELVHSFIPLVGVLDERIMAAGVAVRKTAASDNSHSARASPDPRPDRHASAECQLCPTRVCREAGHPGMIGASGHVTVQGRLSAVDTPCSSRAERQLRRSVCNRSSDMKILVTSASGANGDGYGQLLAFSIDGAAQGAFSNDLRIVDPRGLRVNANRQLLYVNSGDDRIVALDPRGEVQYDTCHIQNLNAGGGNLGPDERYYVGLRTERTIAAFPPDLDGIGTPILQPGVVPFPRGFAFASDGALFLASGVGPDGRGENAILRFAPGSMRQIGAFAADDTMSPLDLAIAPQGNILVSSEFPFGSPAAITSVREYDADGGALVRVFSAPDNVPFRRPRGLRFGPDGHLYCTAQDGVIAFDYESGHCLGMVVDHPRLNGQAIEFFGD
ncbi:hypothetical protein [Burkholderia sp. Bp9017]|uniref:hypothetical protein n=1 Tax=Burkholderia sp. Bp9017 TaxID=2184565 RepID=UPI000F5F0B19|nr:hypothetical protein [Burkholderia sp. Bp9017]